MKEPNSEWKREWKGERTGDREKEEIKGHMKNDKGRKWMLKEKQPDSYTDNNSSVK